MHVPDPKWMERGWNGAQELLSDCRDLAQTDLQPTGRFVREASTLLVE
jgi:hypothetical protein